MGFLTTLYADADARWSTPPPHDDFWYHPVGWVSESGVRVSPSLALTLPAVWQAVHIYAKSVASLPCLTYRRIDAGKERATSHPLYYALRWQPNQTQTAYEYWEMKVGHVVTRGNAYSRIVPGRRGFADQLVPLHPDRTFPERLPSGRIRYKYIPPLGETQFYTQDEIFHVRGLGSDTLMGLSLIAYGTQSFGGMIAQQSLANRFFKQGMTASVVVKHPGDLDDEEEDDVRASITKYAAGLDNSMGMLLLPDSFSIDKLGISPEDAQLLATREFGVEDVARWFDLPLHRLRVNKPGAVSYSSVEMFQLDLIVSSLRPILVCFEQAIQRDLILDDEKDVFFTEFLIDALLRGDSKSRAMFYWRMFQMGAFTINDILELENRNRVPGGDRRYVPLNMVPIEQAGQGRIARQAPRASREARFERQRLRGCVLAHETAQRCVQREHAAVTRAAHRFAKDADGWRAWLREFYGEHGKFVTKTLGIAPSQAEEYCARHGLQLEQEGVAVMEEWEWTEALELAALAMGADEVAA